MIGVPTTIVSLLSVERIAICTFIFSLFVEERHPTFLYAETDTNALSSTCSIALAERSFKT